MNAWLTSIPLLADWATSALSDLDPNKRFSLIVVVIGCATGVICTLGMFISSTINSIHRRRLEAEILILRHQLNVLRQRAPRRGLHLRWVDRVLFIWLYRRCPHILDAITIVRPETVVRWHRRGFTAYWRWKSRSPGGRPPIAKEVRDLIRRMSLENPLWGATKIHGELLKLGIDVAQSTVSIYMVPRRDRPLQAWKTFLTEHLASRSRLVCERWGSGIGPRHSARPGKMDMLNA